MSEYKVNIGPLRAAIAKITPARLRHAMDNAFKDILNDLSGAVVLKPCPFCGSSDVADIYDGRGSSHRIRCYSCDTHTKLSKSKNAVIEIWNSRPADETYAASLKVVGDAGDIMADALDEISVAHKKGNSIDIILKKYSERMDGYVEGSNE